MNVKAMPVRLTHGVAERIDRLVGKQKRAQFIRDAVDKALKDAEERSNDTSR